MRLPGEDRGELNTAEAAWRLLEPWGRTPDNTTLERHAVYTFQARWADTGNQGRLLLAGDAAHLMPPFAGQGMCSGLRDATNLSWKLDRVLRGVCSEELLDTYTTERREHLQHAISMSVALGRTICVLDEDEALARDQRMVAAGADPRTALPPMPPERLGDGAWDKSFTPESLQGMLTPQFRVSDGGNLGLMDDLLRGAAAASPEAAFTLLGYGVDPAAELTVEQLTVLDALGVQSVMLMEEEYSISEVRRSARTRRLVVLDPQAREWFTAAGVRILLVRPDFYAYGAVAEVSQVGGLIDRLGTDLVAGPPRTPDAATTPHRTTVG